MLADIEAITGATEVDEVKVPLTLAINEEATPVGTIEPAEMALEIAFDADAETLAKAAESEAGSIGVVAVAIMEEMLAS